MADQPGPAGAKLPQGGVLHGGFQPVQIPEIPAYGVWRKVDWRGLSKPFDALLENRPRRAE